MKTSILNVNVAIEDNVQSIADGGTTENQIINHKQNLIL